MSDYLKDCLVRELVNHEFGISISDDSVFVEQAVLSEQPQSDTCKFMAKNESDNQNNSIRFFDLIQSIVTAVFFGIMIFIFIFHITSVDGNSMYATLHDTDKLFTSNLFFTPKQGDIIILRTDVYSEPLVKRVIAVAGQTIDIDFESGTVYVDGQVIYEPYIYEPTHLSNGFVGPVTVPEGMLFCMGDNRNNSNDSRLAAIGFIDCRAVLGKVYFNLIPGKDADGTRDWSRFGSVYLKGTE